MPSFDPGKLLRLIDRLAPSLPDVAKTALERSLKGRFPKHDEREASPAADPRWACLAPAGAMPDLSALMRRRPAAPPVDDRAGAMTSHVARTASGQQPYKLFQPADGPKPTMLVVMLHGCTQTPEDFAAGTQMNIHAERHGLLVAYPEQSRAANAQRCWNWFMPQNMRRDSGEAAAIAAVIADVSATHAIPPGRVLVAGLSAGGAMAAIVADLYPELVAAVGIHSGLPTGAAHDVASAFAAMRGASGGRAGAPLASDVPAIVFHGDADATVHPGNAEAIVARIIARDSGLRSSTEAGRSAGGRTFTRTDGRDAAGRVRFESWTVRGAGHAWSGGSAAGTYTDPTGPDATAAMLDFFVAQIAARDAVAAA